MSTPVDVCGKCRHFSNSFIKKKKPKRSTRYIPCVRQDADNYDGGL